jgi:ketosteroid isomerase-like protein
MSINVEAFMSESDVTKQNVKIVEIMLENGHAGRWDIVRPYVADELVLHVPPGLPFGGDYHGWQGYVDILKNIGAFFTELKGGTREIATVGNKVVVMNRLSGRIARNGKPISFPLTDIWELKDGKVVSITAFYYDTKEIYDLASV